MSSLNHSILRHKRDKTYEKLAKPGNDYSVYSNKHYQGETILGEYWVEQVFQDKPSGFYALGLLSLSGENPAVLVIRGFGNWGRLEEFPTEFLPYNDIPDVVVTKSDEQFQAAKKSGVINWLKSKAIKGIKPDVVGQSLGGKVGQQITVEAPAYIHSLVTFNSIGISEEEFKKYKGHVEIFHYINPADLVPYVLGENFLPGTIFQVSDPTIKKYDFLGQPNKLVLDNPLTSCKEVKIEAFNWVRELCQSLKNYSQTVLKQVEALNKIARQESAEFDISISGKTTEQHLEKSYQVVQQEFRKIRRTIVEELLENMDNFGFVYLVHKKVNPSIEGIPKEMKTLSKTVQQEVKKSGKPSQSFNQTLQQEVKDSAWAIQQKFDKLTK